MRMSLLRKGNMEKMIKIYTKTFSLLDNFKEVEEEIQRYIDSKWEILSMASELHDEVVSIIAVMKLDELTSGMFNPWVGHTVRCGGELYKVILCSPEPYLVFDDGSKHYVMSIEPIDGDPDDWIAVNDAQVELVEDWRNETFKRYAKD